MSAVRMCDRCRSIFSENDDGWQTFTAQTVTYDDNGQQITSPLRQDLCGDCAVETPRRRKSNTVEDRIAQLEESNARLDDLTEQINEIKTTPPKPRATTGDKVK